MRALLAGLAVLAAAAPGASAQDEPAALAARLATEVVAVTPEAAAALPEAAAGRVRLRIATRAPGRVKVAVVGPQAGDMGTLANAIDRAGTFRGALIATDGERFHVVTSYDRPVAQILQPVLVPGLPASLEERLLRAVDVLATLDPGPPGDLGAGAEAGPSVAIEVPEAVTSTLRRVLVGIGLAVAAPFVLLTLLLVLRAARRRRESALDLTEARAAARARLVGVAEAVTGLEEAHGTTPGYARLLEHYATAEALVDVPAPGERALRRAAVALDAAEGEAAALRAPVAA